MNAKNYRDELYRLKAHPELSPPNHFVDKRDSFARVYLSMIPFLVAEYIVELRVDAAISGLIFPTGYLLFWAFYYTYYRPGILEQRLSNAGEAGFDDIPKLFLGVLIWFVKVTFVELFRWVSDWIYEPVKPAPTAKVRLVYSQKIHTQTQAKRPEPARPVVPPLPSDVALALRTLGLGDCRDWKTIHHRYRELAKKYHPDLNPELTEAGTRFMKFDAAYKKLQSVKSKFFD